MSNSDYSDSECNSINEEPVENIVYYSNYDAKEHVKRCRKFVIEDMKLSNNQIAEIMKTNVDTDRIVFYKCHFDENPVFTSDYYVNLVLDGCSGVRQVHAEGDITSVDIMECDKFEELHFDGTDCAECSIVNSTVEQCPSVYDNFKFQHVSYEFITRKNEICITDYPTIMCCLYPSHVSWCDEIDCIYGGCLTLHMDEHHTDYREKSHETIRIRDTKFSLNAVENQIGHKILVIDVNYVAHGTYELRCYY